MKKVLIVAQDMKIGGAQKSLLSFLQALADSPQGREYQVELLLFHPHGPFLSRIPPCVHRLPVPGALYWMGAKLRPALLWQRFSLPGLLGEAAWLLRKNRFPASWNNSQKLWQCWKDRIPECRGDYDAAISYIDGTPNYYVMDKVRAKRKILWVHSEYQKQGYEPDFDRPYYEGADGIVTISRQCRECLIKAFPGMEEKIHILENITVAKDVLEKSRLGTCPEFAQGDGLKLVTVGRLHPQKGIDLAAEAAAILKEQKISFQWLVVGEGAQRTLLQEKIQALDIGDCFHLIGARENPYAYMAAAHILVQPSRVEGKSIVLDEAKILCRPIVTTSYTTVGDAIEHGVTGCITPITGMGIAEGIARLARDPELRSRLSENLRCSTPGTEKELTRYLQVML